MNNDEIIRVTQSLAWNALMANGKNRRLQPSKQDIETAMAYVTNKEYKELQSALEDTEYERDDIVAAAKVVIETVNAFKYGLVMHGKRLDAIEPFDDDDLIRDARDLESEMYDAKSNLDDAEYELERVDGIPTCLEECDKEDLAYIIENNAIRYDRALENIRIACSKMEFAFEEFANRLEKLVENGKNFDRAFNEINDASDDLGKVLPVES